MQHFFKIRISRLNQKILDKLKYSQIFLGPLRMTYDILWFINYLSPRKIAKFRKIIISSKSETFISIFELKKLKISEKSAMKNSKCKKPLK